MAQLRAVRTVLRRLAAPAEGQPDAEQVFKETLLKGSRLTFPRHAQRKADAQVGGCVGYACRVCSHSDAQSRIDLINWSTLSSTLTLSSSSIQARLTATAAWREKLVARSQQREYDRMVKNVHGG